MKQTIFNSTDHIIPIHTCLPQEHLEKHLTQTRKIIHTQAVQQHLSKTPPSELLNRPPPEIDKSETSLPRETRRTLAQLRANKSPKLLSYLNHIDPTNYPDPTCPLCHTTIHDTIHLFNCVSIPTTLAPEDLWLNPVEVAILLERWQDARAGLP